jgi:hypothetical protein
MGAAGSTVEIHPVGRNPPAIRQEPSRGPGLTSGLPPAPAARPPRPARRRLPNRQRPLSLDARTLQIPEVLQHQADVAAPAGRPWRCCSGVAQPEQQRRPGRQGPPLVRLDRLPLDGTGTPPGWQRWLLVRRSLTSGELAYYAYAYACAGPAGLPLVALVRVAGSRWRVEEALAGRQGAVRPGLPPGAPLALLVPVGDPGHAGLCVPAGGHGHPARPPFAAVGLIPLTCNEVQHLFATLVGAPVADRGHRLRWSAWRRRQQARARACHYRRQANGP